ncbi:YoaK family protein [Pseudogracilibacillus sp. SE30717A]|uniref:YoaK family protein n=1 Tax=Pseudogracilibacillus sp. SE30717A TaxID=3098293 RepID=UPI00300E19D4
MSKKNDCSKLAKSILTIFSIFLMGFIDAFTYLEYNEVFVSAQTGNIVVMSTKLFSAEWKAAAGHLSVLGGFMAGAFFGEAIIEKVKKIDFSQFGIFLLIQEVFLFILALVQLHIPGSLMVFLLGILAGYELSVFRKIGTTTINNGIMTGNTKNMMNRLYDVVFDKDKKARIDFRNLFLGLIIFMVGVGAGSQVVDADSKLVLWTALFLNSLFLLYLLIKNSFTRIRRSK